MVDGEVGGVAESTAVLAGVVVAKQQVATVWPEQPARDMDGAQQTDDHHALGQPPSGKRLGGRTLGLFVNKGNPLLGQEYDQPPVTDHVERLQ